MTGGWFYDPHLSLFINTAHMYIWLFFFMLPFSFYIVSRLAKCSVFSVSLSPF